MSQPESVGCRCRQSACAAARTAASLAAQQPAGSLYLRTQFVRPQPRRSVDHAVAVCAQQRNVMKTVLPWTSSMQGHDMMALDEAVPAAPVELLEVEVTDFAPQWQAGRNYCIDFPAPQFAITLAGNMAANEQAALTSWQVVLVSYWRCELGQCSLASRGPNFLRPGVHLGRASEETRQDHPVQGVPMSRRPGVVRMGRGDVGSLAGYPTGISEGGLPAVLRMQGQCPQQSRQLTDLRVGVVELPPPVPHDEVTGEDQLILNPVGIPGGAGHACTLALCGTS